MRADSLLQYLYYCTVLGPKSATFLEGTMRRACVHCRGSVGRVLVVHGRGLGDVEKTKKTNGSFRVLRDIPQRQRIGQMLLQPFECVPDGTL